MIATDQLFKGESYVLAMAADAEPIVARIVEIDFTATDPWVRYFSPSVRGNYGRCLIANFAQRVIQRVAE
jgi:hypothetical protein